MSNEKPDVSLTTAQIREGLGAELFSLCQGITADGKLTPVEVAELERWLEKNKNADLPGIVFLTTTLRRILVDGRVTRDEQTEMLNALQVVLPVAVRAGARAAKQEIRRPSDPAVLHRQLKEEVDRARKRCPEDEFDFMVAGVQFEGRSKIVESVLKVGDRVRLNPQPDNAAGDAVISVTLSDGRPIGFVPRTDSKEMKECMSDGGPYVATVEKICAGSLAPVPVILLALFKKEQTEDIKDMKPDTCRLPPL